MKKSEPFVNQIVHNHRGDRRVVNGRELNPWSYGVSEKGVVPEQDLRRYPKQSTRRKTRKTNQSST